jgi:hypothetical protein
MHLRRSAATYMPAPQRRTSDLLRLAVDAAGSAAYPERGKAPVARAPFAMFLSLILIPANLTMGSILIKLSDYSPAVLKFIKTNDLACLYVFAVAGHQPCKIGHALSLRHRHGLVQEAHAEEITIEFLVWCPSAATAALISEDARHRLGGTAGRAGWWNIEPVTAIEVVRKACSMFPSRGILEHAKFIAHATAAGFTVPAARLA